MASRGETQGIRSVYDGSLEHFIQKSDAEYGNYARDRTLFREGTPMQYFLDDSASKGNASDYKRLLEAS